MRTELAVYTVLLAAGLGTAYWASLPVVEGDEEKVSVFALEPKQVSEVTLTTKDTEVKASRRDTDERFWVGWQKSETVDKPKPVEPPKTGTGTDTSASTSTSVAAEAEKETKVTTERFLANEKMDELTAAFNPLKAMRVFSKVDEKQLVDFGLKDPTDKFTIKAGSQSLTLFLGKKSYGSSNRFVLEGDAAGKPLAGGRVLLLEDKAFENLERANLRLYDRRLVKFELDDVDKAEVKAGDKNKRLGHTQRDKSGELAWSDDGEGGAIKQSYGTWMDKVSKLRLSGFADEAQVKALAGVAPFVEIVFAKDGKALDTLSFRKLPGDKPEYFATSRFLGTQAKLVQARVEPVEKDVAALMSGGAEPAPPAASPAVPPVVVPPGVPPAPVKP